MTEFPDRLREAWANLPLGVRVVLIILALCLVALLCARPLRSGLRALALERNSRLAESALVAGDALEARSRSLAAIQSAPERVEIVRTVLRSMNILGDPKRIQVSTILMRHPSASSADRQLAMEVLASHAPMVMAGAAWSSLSKEEKAIPGMIDPFARRLIAEGKPEQATLLLKGVDSSQLPDLLYQLFIDLLQDQGSPEAWFESQRLLLQRAKAASDANEAMPDWCMAGWERVPQKHLDSSALAVFPGNGPPRIRMLRLRLEQGDRPLKLQDPRIAAWLREIELCDRLGFASLLANCGQESTALELLEKGSALTLREYEWVRQIRISSRAWRPWLDFLKSPAVAEIRRVWVNADQALAHFQLNEMDAFRNAWREAIQLASVSTQVPRLTDLSHRVRPWMPAQAAEAMLTATSKPGQALPLFNDLQWLAGLLEQARNDKALLDLSRAYLGIEPGNPVAITRYAYLALLAGELSPAAAIQLVSPVVRDQPRSPHPRVVAVIATLLQGDRSAASDWIARDQIRWESTPQFYQWLVARAEMADGAPPPPEKGQLLPTEGAMIEKLR